MFLLDNGHGVNTPGKRSPKWKDGSQLFEFEFNRDIVKRIAKGLDSLAIPYKILVPEEIDISLVERVRRANAIKDSILISVHANAGGGTGFEIYTSPGKTQSDSIATVVPETSGLFKYSTTAFTISEISSLLVMIFPAMLATFSIRTLSSAFS